MEDIILYCIAGVVALALLLLIVYANLPTKWTVGAAAPSAAFMAKAKLVLIRDEARIDMKESVEAEKLLAERPTLVIVVRRPGCPFCRKHAAEMSALFPEIDATGIQMIAVVHEPRGVNNFKKFFKGNVFYDDERRFYGEKQRWLPIWMGFLRIGLYFRMARTIVAGYRGNLSGEGRLLGGMYLILNGQLSWAYLEKEYGDMPDAKLIRQAIKDHAAKA